MRRLVIIGVVALQLATLAWMAGEREWVLRTGKTVWLRTAPIDPQDPMRGDYVRLNYEIGTVPKSLCRDGILAWFDAARVRSYERARERRVYASVQLDAEGVGHLSALSDRRPAEGVFLRGRSGAVYPSGLDARFGIEAFFMQQGKARAFEETQGGEKAGVPLDMEVAVSSSGLAVLKGYRWEPLGLTIVLDRNPPATGNSTERRPGVRGLTIELKNHGDVPQAVVTAPRAFRLVPAAPRWTVDESDGWRWVGEKGPMGALSPSDVVVLPPHTSFQQHIDLTTPVWFVQKRDGKNAGVPVSIESLGSDWSAAFRIEYAPPSVVECTGLPQAEMIRHASVSSRRFNAAAGVD